MREAKVVLVTGTSSGIGAAIADLLARRGFRVFGTQRRPPQQGSGVEKQIVTLPLDVRDEQSVSACIASVLEQAGRIDGLVNNAGYALMGAAEETTVAEARALFETNFFGILRMSQAVLPHFRKQGYGRIVNVGSVAGFVPAPYESIYAASKHAVAGYSQSLDHEVRQFGVRVSVVAPGFVQTRIADSAQVALDLLPPYEAERSHAIETLRQSVAQGANAGEVAAVVLRALSSRHPRQVYLAGSEARRVAMLRRFMPAGLFEQGLRKQFGLSRS